MRTGRAGPTRWLPKVGPGQPDAICSRSSPLRNAVPAGVTRRKPCCCWRGPDPGGAFRLTAPARQVRSTALGGAKPQVPATGGGVRGDHIPRFRRLLREVGAGAAAAAAVA